MFCRKCGKEIDSSSKFCPYCGEVLETNETNKENNQNNQQVHKKRWPWIIAITCIALVILYFIGGSSDNEEAEKIIKKLQEFTYVDKGEDQYTFDYNGNWNVVYVDVNEFVEFNNSAITDFLIYQFGTYDVGNNGRFIYDFDENAFRIYLDCETEEGNFTTINYDLDNSEITLMVDDERYLPSETFEKDINDYGTLELMRDQLTQFQRDLAFYDLSLDDLEEIDYDNIKNVLD